jgi:hypothetical protein
MTLSRSLLHLIMEGVGKFDGVRHNDPFRLVTLYLLPNGIWLVFPMFIAFALAPSLLIGGSRKETSSLFRVSSLSMSPKEISMAVPIPKSHEKKSKTPTRRGLGSTPEKPVSVTSVKGPRARSKSRALSSQSTAPPIPGPSAETPIPVKRRGRPRKSSP